jgi:N-glycosylase/DNA lyase
MNNDQIAKLRNSYVEKRELITKRLSEFKEVYNAGTDERIFEELVFCICTAGASAKMGLMSVEAARDILADGSLQILRQRLRGVHRFPNKRPEYIVHTREYLKSAHGFKLKGLLQSLEDPLLRREFFAENKDIKGIGYKESSHFLRNIGFSGYGILDKHILNTLHEYRVINSPKPPATKDEYLAIERKFILFSEDLEIHPDELDLLLWSEKTGEILK